jgi:CheY-like chemotaxis protein
MVPRDKGLTNSPFLAAAAYDNNTALFEALLSQPLAALSKPRRKSPGPEEASLIDGTLGRGCGAACCYEILLAEDHPINLKLLLALLQAAGCRWRCASNGLQVLAELESADFDLIVMDSRMPVMTGIEAISIIRRRTDWKRLIPILSLTAHAMKGAEAYHTSVGADLYMSKPLQSDCFIGAVRNLAQRGRELRVKYAVGSA